MVWQRESSNLLIILAAASFPTTRKRNTNQLFFTPTFVFRPGVVDLFSLDSYDICLQMKTMIRGLLMLRNMITNHCHKSISWLVFFFIGPESNIWQSLSVTHWQTHPIPFSRLDWCDPGVRRCQLKTCWYCNCCWWGSCWQQFVVDFEAEVWSKS